MDRMGHEEEMKISYFQVDGNGRMAPAALLAILQEAAVSHSDALGYTVDFMVESQSVWAIVNWHIKTYRMPHQGERITVQTWSDQCRRIQATRSFFLFDEQGHKIVDGASRWIFMDFSTRKPRNVSEEMIQAYGAKQEPAIENEKFSMPKEADGELVGTHRFTVTRRDTDTNGHANNVKYLEWAMDDVPDEIYDEHQIGDIRVAYRKECVRGDEVMTETYCKHTEGMTEVLTFIKNADDAVIAEVVTLWL